VVKNVSGVRAVPLALRNLNVVLRQGVLVVATRAEGYHVRRRRENAGNYVESRPIVNGDFLQCVARTGWA
jgi:hypothetical protein